MYSSGRRSRSNERRGRGDRSRSPRGEGSRREERGSRRRRRDDDDTSAGPAAAAAAAAWGPYAGYAGYAAAAAANYWDYAQQAQMGGEEEKKKKKKKKKKQESSSSSSSSDSEEDAKAQWQDMWKSWQQGGGMQSNMQGAPQGQAPGMGWPGYNPWGQPPPHGGWPGGDVGGSSSSTNQGQGGDGGWGLAQKDDEDDDDLATADGGEDVPIFLEPSVEELVPVPKALLGKVIGKQAATIIEIREKSGAFKVDARDQTSDPCQVKVAGTAEAVRKARALILELIDMTKAKHTSSHYVEIPRSKIGMVIGLKGAQVNEVQQQTGTKIDVEFDSDPCKCFIKGEPDNVDRAKKVLLTIAMQIEDEASEYLDLPKNTSGALIGAGGQRIRTFQEQSGARIDIDKSGTRCKVRLTGTQDAVTMAKSMIMTELEKNMPATKTPGTPGFGGGASHQPMVIPSHQPNSFPATLSESIARARAAAEAVKHGLISTTPAASNLSDAGFGGQIGGPPAGVMAPPPPRPPPAAGGGGQWGGCGGGQWGGGGW